MRRAGMLVRSLVLGAAAVAVAASPLVADWLVMKDGSGRYETKGAWEVRGNQVVFYRPNGTLSSMKLADIDVDASKAATEAAAHPQPTPAPTPTPPKKASVVTLTDADVAHVEPAPAAAAVAAAAAAPAAKPSDRLQITEFHQDMADVVRGVTIVGDASNISQDLIGDFHCTGRLFDETGKEIASNEAMLASPSLKPGARTTMRINFPGVYAYKDARFECKSMAVKTSNTTTKP